ncbi:MAG: helix-turn-helix domain-containing protein [Thermoanaerobaculia bacterium]
MQGGLLIREARRRAGLTQAELAARLGTTQSAVARWEGGAHEPAFATVARAVRACGLDPQVRLVEADDHDDGLITYTLSLSPAQRVAYHEDLLEMERRLAKARILDA